MGFEVTRKRAYRSLSGKYFLKPAAKE
jgi:hypothetical protein